MTFMTHRNVIFDSLESHAFKKHVWSFKHFVFVYLQDVCKMCARCAQYVSKMYAYVMFDIIEPHAFRKYSTCWVLEKSEEPCRILKKFECVVNVIHAKVLPGSVRYIEH